MSLSSFYKDFTFSFNFLTKDLYFSLISCVFTKFYVFSIFFYYSSRVDYYYCCWALCCWECNSYYLLIKEARYIAFLMFLSKCTSLADTWILYNYFIFYCSLRFYSFSFVSSNSFCLSFSSISLLSSSDLICKGISPFCCDIIVLSLFIS